jgi:hypothetical protein
LLLGRTLRSERLGIMQKHAHKLVGIGALGLAVAIAGASCREEGTLRKGPSVTVREPHVVSPTTEEITLGGELTGIMVERAPAKPAARAPIARREPVVEPPPIVRPPTEEPAPEITPPDIVPEPPAIPPRAALRPEAPAPPERGNETAIRTALVVGLAGVAAGATAAGASDGTTGDTVVTATFLGIGLAGLATAGILHATTPARPVNVMVGPGAIGVRGTF